MIHSTYKSIHLEIEIERYNDKKKRTSYKWTGIESKADIQKVTERRINI